jgi:hypothetical protein
VNEAMDGPLSPTGKVRGNRLIRICAKATLFHIISIQLFTIYLKVWSYIICYRKHLYEPKYFCENAQFVILNFLS